MNSEYNQTVMFVPNNQQASGLEPQILHGEAKYSASCNIFLALNNSFLEDLPWRFCFVMKTTNFRSNCTCTTRRPITPLFKFDNLLPLANFVQKHFIA